MTGEEYWKLNRGDTVKVINSVDYDSLKVGDILIMEFMSQMNEHVYFRNTRNNEVCMLDTFAVLSSLSMTDEEPADKKVINLPFALHDNVWFMCHDKAYLGRITSYHINSVIATGEPSIKYEIIFKNDSDYSETAHDIPSNKCFSTKEELLKSL
jgi:hypothetical protein